VGPQEKKTGATQKISTMRETYRARMNRLDRDEEEFRREQHWRRSGSVLRYDKKIHENLFRIEATK